MPHQPAGEPRPAAAGIPREEFLLDACAIPEMRHVGWTQYPEADTEGLAGHVHQDAYEICYMVRGTATWWVGREILEVEPGSIFVTWPGELHGGLDGAMHPCELFWVQLAFPAKGRCLDLSEAETRCLRERFEGLPRRLCAGEEAICGHYRRVLAELRRPTPLAPAAIRASLRLLCLDVLRAFDRQPSGGQGQRTWSPRIAEAIGWFHRQMQHAISVEEAADAVGLKPSYFREAFRRETGFSPLEFLTRLRIREAKRRLVETGESITDIAFELGFSSSQYFSTVFRKHTGLAPSVFRERRQTAAHAGRIRREGVLQTTGGHL